MKRWSLHAIVVLFMAFLIAGAARAADAVQLLVEDADLSVKEMDASLLLREVLRQAVLIAARDELNLPTRDAAVREPMNPAVKTLTLHFSAAKGAPISFSLSVTGQQQPLFESKIDTPPTPYVHRNCLPIAQTAEAMSRKEFVKALQDAGFQKAAPTTENRPTTQPQAGDEDRASEFNLISQLEVVRRAHRELAHDANSVSALQSLVRGYANLGQVTEYYWNAAPEVFHARSLIYSERLLAKHPGRLSLQYRAYARAMAGFHKAAIEDLDQADKEKANVACDPAWVPLISALCRYDTQRLSDLASENPKIAPLAMFLCFLTVERSGS
ncbi:MAG TPA: hypothetical protein VL282_13050, partial [Tepidisphaeraceae bacterium]|nr:hypothetical protein [Tepidisphaeraceae bacterium]